MIVPYDRLSPEALQAVIEEYVTRDGTEHTESATKATQVRNALERGELILVFDTESETCNFLAPDAVSSENTIETWPPEPRQDSP